LYVFFVKNKFLLILLLITLLGLFLRLSNITIGSYWLDELFSVAFSHPKNSFNQMLTLTLEDVHPPLYQALLWFWYKIFGLDEFSGRFFSSLIGLLVIISSYYLSKEFLNKKDSLFISLLISTNIFLILLSQEVRYYQLYMFFSILSFLFFYKYLIKKDFKDLIFYWISSSLWIYTHYYSFIFLASQLIFLIFYLMYFETNRKKLLKDALKTIIFLIIISIPLIKYIFLATKGDKFWWIDSPSIFYFFNYMVYYFKINILGFIIIGFLFTIYFITFNDLKKEQKVQLSFLLFWIVLGIFLPYFISLSFTPLVNLRYSIILILPIYIISLYGLSKTNSTIKLLFSMIFLFFIFNQLYVFSKTKIIKPQFREVLFYINKFNKVPIYELIKENGHNGHNINHFQVYSDMLGLNLKIIDDFIFEEQKKSESLPKCFWLIYSYYSPTFKNQDDILNLFDVKNNPDFKLIKRKKFESTETVLFSYKEENIECKNLLKKVKNRK